MIRKTIVAILTILLLLSHSMKAQNTESVKTSDEELMKWFTNARFGMFITFGAASEDCLTMDGNKTEIYEASVANFNPVDFDAAEWVRIAKDAGMKYIVFTTKWHDGLCMWNSKLTKWDIIDQTKFKRDLVAELADACKEAGIKLGFYYSIADWYHPEFDPSYNNRNGFHFKPNKYADITKYMGFMYGQIKELCENYQPSLFWFDGATGFREENKKRLLGQQEMVNMLNSYGTICNSRYGDDDALKFVNYLSMGDNMSPPGNIGVPFETAQTMNDTWHFKEGDNNWKSAKLMLEMLTQIAGHGGNYLLNVGPDSKGIIPAESKKRLKIMGEWLKKYGEAIYETKASPYPYEIKWGSITQREKGDNTILYLNVADWPENGIINLYGLNNKIMNISLLNTDITLQYEEVFVAEAGLNTISINIPKTAPDPYVSVIALEIKGKPSIDQSFLQQSDGSVILDAYFSTIHDNEFIPNKPSRPIDLRIFTVVKDGEGIMPSRGMTVAINKTGQALSWNFKIIEPGVYNVAVLSNINKNLKWKADGSMRVTVAGQTLENQLTENERINNSRMPRAIMNSVSILGTVEIKTAGMYTLTLEVSSDFNDFKPDICNVQLIPVK